MRLGLILFAICLPGFCQIGVKTSTGENLPGVDVSRQIHMLEFAGSAIGFHRVAPRFRTNDRGNMLSAIISAKAAKDIVAVQFRLSLFDVFNELIETFGVTEVAMTKAGDFFIEPEWYTGRDIHKALTLVAYPARVRFADGTVWAVHLTALQSQLKKMDLSEREAHVVSSQ